MLLCSKIIKNIAENIPYSFYNNFNVQCAP